MKSAKDYKNSKKKNVKNKTSKKYAPAKKTTAKKAATSKKTPAKKGSYQVSHFNGKEWVTSPTKFTLSEAKALQKKSQKNKPTLYTKVI